MFVSSLVMAVIFYYSWVQIAKLHKFGATTPSLRLPMYVPYLPIGIFTALITLLFFAKGCTHLKGLFTGKVEKQNTREGSLS